MRERIRRLWRDLTYDPTVELQRAKELLARRLEWSEAKEHERRRSQLKLWRSDEGTENKEVRATGPGPLGKPQNQPDR